MDIRNGQYIDVTDELIKWASAKAQALVEEWQ